MFDLPLIQHSEILDLTNGGCMNEGHVSTELGLKGMPTEAEDIMVYRDIALLEKTGGRLHVAHISSGESVELVRRAKAKGLAGDLRGGSASFHFDRRIGPGLRHQYQNESALRAQSDIDAIKEGLKDGTIDIIATDHAPHDLADKQADYHSACFGIVGLETALPLSLRLVDEKILTLPQLVEKLTSRPAEIFKLDQGTLGVGKQADVVIFDPGEEYKVEASQIQIEEQKLALRRVAGQGPGPAHNS